MGKQKVDRSHREISGWFQRRDEAFRVDNGD